MKWEEIDGKSSKLLRELQRKPDYMSGFKEIANTDEDLRLSHVPAIAFERVSLHFARLISYKCVEGWHFSAVFSRIETLKWEHRSELERVFLH